MGSQNVGLKGLENKLIKVNTKKNKKLPIKNIPRKTFKPIIRKKSENKKRLNSNININFVNLGVLVSILSPLSGFK